MKHSNLKKQAEEFLTLTNTKPADLLAISATRTIHRIETASGDIEVMVNPYIPSGSIYLVNKEAFNKEWMMPDAPTNRI
jgi:hypothetical protein